MAYLVGGFGSALLLSYLIIYKGLKGYYSRNHKGLEEKEKEGICFWILVIVFSIIIIAAENRFR